MFPCLNFCEWKGDREIAREKGEGSNRGKKRSGWERQEDFELAKEIKINRKMERLKGRYLNKEKRERWIRQDRKFHRINLISMGR